MVTPRRPNYGFKVTPKEMLEALRTLSKYVMERKAVIEADKVTEVNEAVRMQDSLFILKETIAQTIKTPLEAAYDRLRFGVVPGLMDKGQIATLKLTDVGRVHLQDDVQVKVLDKNLLYNLLKAGSNADLIQETVNAQTLAAHIRECMREDKPIPGGPPPDHPPEQPWVNTILEVKPIVRAVITRGK